MKKKTATKKTSRTKQEPSAPPEITPVKGFKIFNPDFSCNGMQYKENDKFKHTGAIEICSRGLHFCLKAQDCFRYYSFDPANIVCEVEAIGKVVYHEEDSKACTDILVVGRRLSWHEVLAVANSGSNNTGHSNSGNRNSGNRNSGNRNSGNRNSGNRNSGDSNSGNRNSGDRNSGDSNSGNWNSGNWNSGDWNSGNWNSGNWNSGDRNSGDSNSGDSNSGNRNSGNWNSGNWNSGDSNSGNRNSGAFCTDPNPVIFLFNKPTSLTVKEWERHEAISIMSNLEPTIWVPDHAMTDKEKEANPKWETTEGYLKTISMKEAWANLWHNLTYKKKQVFKALPNFDAAIFQEITGLKL